MSTILIVSPDYASHYFPLSAVGGALKRRGHHVVVATGQGLAPTVAGDGFEHRHIALGPGSNPGLLRTETQSDEEQSQIREFLEATKQGMVPTLLHQARNRQRDLFHQPDKVARDLTHLLDAVDPDCVVVDQLAFVVTAILRGLRRPFIAFHPGHPSAIPMGRPYGYPPRIPGRIRVDYDGLAELEAISRGVVERFTGEYNDVVRSIDPTAPPIADAFAAMSPHGTLINFPSQLTSSHPLPEPARYVGSSIRPQILPSEYRRRNAERGRRPRIYASLGSFFSGRSDILRLLVAAFRDHDVELVLATGITPRSELGTVPNNWIVSDYLPQPALIRTSDLVITHGGNNTVTEALTAGVPMLVGPLSTDQFSAAADIESAGLGAGFDPNFDDPEAITDLALEVFEGDAPARAAELGRELRAHPGPEIAASLVEKSIGGLAVA